MNPFHNQHWPDAKPTISVLIPFLNDDPSPLLSALAAEAKALGGEVEAILLDDGTGDPALTGRLTAFAASAPMPICLITAASNNGRAAGRNILIGAARGEYVLFVDADMLPDDPDFLSRWLYLVREARPAAAFGGFSVKQAPRDPRFNVHRLMAMQSDCLTAEERAKAPLKTVFTSNLLVARDKLAQCPFDASFAGWGWEDVEWAIRFGQSHGVQHVDIPATHMGLDDVPTLMKKYDQSAKNFARISRLHLDLIAEFPSFKVANIIHKFKLGAGVLAISRSIATTRLIPARLRGLALRFYRAARYAEAIETR